MATNDKINQTSAVPLTTDAAGAASGSAEAQPAGGKEEEAAAADVRESGSKSLRSALRPAACHLT